MVLPARLMRYPCMCALMNGFQQPVHSAPSAIPAKMHRRYVPVMLKAKLKSTIPKKFSDYWWLFQKLHVLCYSTRLAEEERKKEKRSTILNFDRFRFAILKYFTISTADWDRLYKLLYVLLDARICALAMIPPCKR